MKKRLSAVLLAAGAVMLAAGCGSTESTSSGASASTNTPAASSGSTGSKSSGPKVAGTPKHAAPSSSAAGQGGVVQVAYRDIAIDPNTLRVKVGSTIKWTNYDSVEHNVSTESGPQKFASKNFGESASYEIKLTKLGVIHYECTIHPTTMNATIDVVK